MFPTERERAIEELRQAYRNQQLDLFIGAGVSRLPGSELAGWIDMFRPLADKLGKSIPGNSNQRHLTDLAMEYEQFYTRRELEEALYRAITLVFPEPNAVHRRMAKLSFRKIYTTNYDSLIERAFVDLNRPYGQVLKPTHYRGDGRSTDIIKVCGKIDPPSDLVITTRDYEKIEDSKRWIFDTLRVTLRERTLLFVGYGIDDSFINKVLGEIHDELEGQRHCAYTLAINPDEGQRLRWRARGVQIIDLANVESNESGNVDYLKLYLSAFDEIFGPNGPEDAPVTFSTTTISKEDASEQHIPKNAEPETIKIGGTNLVAPSSVAPPEIDPNDVIDRTHRSHLEACLELMRKGHFNAAKSRLETVLGYAPLDPELHQRILLNLALAELHTGSRSSAISSMERAIQILPTSDRGILFTAVAAQLENKHAEAIAAINLHRDQGNVDVIRVRSHSIADLHGNDAALQFLEALDDQRPEIRVLYAERLFAASRYDAVIEQLQPLVGDDDSLEIRCLFALALGMPIVDKHQGQQGTEISLSAADRVRLSEARGALEVVIAKLRETDRITDLLHAHTNMSAFCALLGDHVNGTAFATFALAIQPKNLTALLNLHASACVGEAWEQALSAANRILELQKDPIDFHRGIASALNARKFDDADTLLSEYLDSHPDPAVDYYVLKSRLNVLQGKIANAEEAVREGIARHPKEAMIFVEAGRLASHIRRYSEAEGHFLMARSLAGTGNDRASRTELGWFYLSQKQWQKAADSFFGKREIVTVTPYLAPFLVSLFNQERVKECVDHLEALENQRSEWGVSVFDIAACIFGRIGDWGRALSAASDALLREPSPVRFENLIQIYLRLGQRRRAAEESYNAVAAYPDDQRVLLVAARAYISDNQPKEAWKLAKHALTQEPTNVSAMQLATLAALRLGESDLTPDEWVEAQGIIAQLGSIADSGVELIPITPEFERIIALVKERGESANQLLQYYRERKLPIHSLSTVLAEPFIRVWNEMGSGRLSQIWMAIGTQQEQESEVKTVGATDAICIDITALLTLQMLGLLSVIPKLFAKAYVPYGVIEQLVKDRERLEFSRGSSSLSFEEGRLRLGELDEAAIDRIIQLGDDLLTELHSGRFTLIGGVPRGPGGHDSSAIVLGDAAASVVAGAVSKVVPLLSDDYALRRLAKQAQNVDGFCTQALLRVAHSRGVISQREYSAAVLHLFKRGYKFVSDGIDTLVFALTSDRFDASETVTRLLSRISEPEITKEVSATILGEAAAFIFQYGRNRDQLFELIRSQILAFPPSELNGRILDPFVTGLLRGSRLSPSSIFGAIEALSPSTDQGVFFRNVSTSIARRKLRTVVNRESRFRNVRLERAALRGERILTQLPSRRRTP